MSGRAICDGRGLIDCDCDMGMVQEHYGERLCPTCDGEACYLCDGCPGCVGADDRVEPDTRVSGLGNCP